MFRVRVRVGKRISMRVRVSNRVRFRFGVIVREGDRI